MNAIVIVIHSIAALLLVLFVLLHAGRGGGLSEAFGGGLGGGLGGSNVMEKNLDRITIVTAIIFFITTLFLAVRLQ